MTSYAKAMPDKHGAWKSLLKKLDKHEEELRRAACLNPGTAENDVFRMWRFSQNLNSHEVQRLQEERKELQRKIEDFKNDGSRSALKKQESLKNKMQRLDNHYKETQRKWEDIREVMQGAGFRLDDPAAADILD